MSSAIKPLAVLCLLVLLSLSASSSAQEGEEFAAAFKAWAREAMHPVESLELDVTDDDLAAFGKAVGEARIVAVGDAVEGSAEPLQMRNRLFRYLVEEKGFTTIILESGIIEGQAVDEFLSDDSGDFESAMVKGITHGFHQYTGNRDLVRWMRDWNAEPNRASTLRFFGFDVSGSPLNRMGESTADAPLRAALAYLQGVDPEAAVEFNRRFDTLLPALFWDFAGAMCLADGGPWCVEVPEADRAALAGRKQYFDLDAGERDRLTAAIADLVALIDRHPLKYRKASSSDAYEWGLRAAVAAQQTDAFLRARVPLGWSPADGPPMAGDGAQLGRSSAMVDNFEWILDRLGEDDKVLVYATRFHIAGAPLAVGNDTPILPFGAELRERYGQDVVVVGNLVAEGESACGMQMVLPIPRPAPDTVDGTMASLEVPHFYVDLREAPAGLASWLRQPQTFQAGGTLRTAPAEAFDVLFYTGRLSAACPIDPAAFRVPLPEGL